MTYPLQRPLGDTGILVSALGLGCGHIGEQSSERSDDLPDDHAIAALLHGALDLGVTLFDVARSYGQAEEHLGRFLADRRAEVVLSTKGGYGVEGVADWTGAAITLGIERALRTLRTEVIDIFHLHSCPLAVAARAEILEALAQARQQGKIRVAAYSGENEELAWAIESGCFGAVQTSVNLFDQQGLRAALPLAQQRGVGVLAKRPLGNAPWRFAARPAGHYAEEYWTRMRAMALPEPAEGGLGGLGGLGWIDRAVRFSAYAPGVSSALLGTSRLAHLTECVTACVRGPLPREEQDLLQRAFATAGPGWRGQI